MTLRVLVAGLGAVGQRHARNLRSIYGMSLELLAFRQRRLRHVVTESLDCDDDRDVERELGITAFEDLDRALAARPQAVFVCTPSNQHVDIAQRSAESGCHVFIEKPVSHTIEGVERLRQTVVAKQVVAAVGCQWRFHPCLRWLHGVVRKGELGQLLSADIEYGEYLPDWHPYEDYRTSYAARAAMGGGVVLTQIHDYDLAWWLFGAPLSVTAAGGHQSELEIDVEDSVDARLEGGAVPVRVRQSFATRPARRVITVVGERGTLTIDLLAARITAPATLAGPELANDYRRNQMFLDEVSQFAACLEGRETPAVPLDDGIAVLRLALAVKEAIRTGREVPLR